MAASYVEREAAPGPKRLLALDGGGIRGLLTVQVLKELESRLRTELAGGDPDFRLCDYFDYVGGTSTGAIIATLVALGYSAEEIDLLYQRLGDSMFVRSWWPPGQSLYQREPVQEGIADELGAGLSLGSSRFRSLLMMVMKNRTTDSPWPISNNTNAVYNDRTIAKKAGRPSNLDLPVWQLVRASTAAPVYFPSERIHIQGSKTSFDARFVDGGVTPLNNPAYQLFLMATVDAYQLGWDTGVDKLLLVSVGTGSRPHSATSSRPMGILRNVVKLPGELIGGSGGQQDLLCRVAGETRHAPELGDRELDLRHDLSDRPRRLNLGANLPKSFTYVRYDALLTDAGLADLGVTGVDPAKVAKLDATDQADQLVRIGTAVANRVDLEHFGSHIEPARN